MIELYIDGVVAVLPENFEITLTEENTFLTKSGEYTFDIELSLQNATNARLYKHINRVNSSLSFVNRKAILIVDNLVLMNGIEQILKVSDRSVHIQLLSGNAELNVIGNQNKITELDLGEMEARIITSMEDCNLIYPEVNWGINPVKCNGVVPEIFYYTIKNFIHPYTIQQSIRPNNAAYIVPQPYLLFYVTKIMESLGITISSNCLLNDERARRIFICNEKVRMVEGVPILKYKDLLPEWTVSEFIIEIEKFFNVVFVLDAKIKTISIVKGNSFYEESRTYLEDVIDEFETSYIPDNQLENYDYENVEYSFSGAEQYKYMKLANEILDAAMLITFDTFDLLKTECANLAAHTDKRELFYVTQSDRYYIFEIDANLTGGYRLIPVHGFKGHGDGKQVTELRIIPAPTERYAISMKPLIGDDAVNRYAQVPVIPFDTNGLPIKIHTLPQPYENEFVNSSMVSVIEDGLTEDKTMKDRLYISINSGLDPIRNHYGGDTSVSIYPIYNIAGEQIPNILFPISQNDNYYSDYDNFEAFRWSQELKAKRAQLLQTMPYTPTYNELYNEIIALEAKEKLFTLRILGNNGLYNEHYVGSTVGDYTKQYIFDFPAGRYNARGLYVIKNREFICEKIESKINAKGFEPMVRGYFYAKG